MILYSITSPWGLRLVLGKNKRAAIARLVNCHHRQYEIPEEYATEYTGNPPILTTEHKPGYGIGIILRCDVCKELKCDTDQNVCTDCSEYRKTKTRASVEG